MGVVLVQSLLLGLFGTVAGAVVAIMAAGVLDSVNVRLPVFVELLLLSDSEKLWFLSETLGGASAIVFVITALMQLDSGGPSRFECSAAASRSR